MREMAVATREVKLHHWAMTPKVTPPSHIKWPDVKLRFSKFDIVPKVHQWSELFETRSVQ